MYAYDQQQQFNAALIRLHANPQHVSREDAQLLDSLDPGVVKRELAVLAAQQPATGGGWDALVKEHGEEFVKVDVLFEMFGTMIEEIGGLKKRTDARIKAGDTALAKENAELREVIAVLKTQNIVLEARMSAVEARGYTGIWNAERAYTVGQSVTFDNSQWIAMADSKGVRPPAPAWQLSCRKGKDGKDGKDLR